MNHLKDFSEAAIKFGIRDLEREIKNCRNTMALCSQKIEAYQAELARRREAEKSSQPIKS